MDQKHLDIATDKDSIDRSGLSSADHSGSSRSLDTSRSSRHPVDDTHLDRTESLSVESTVVTSGQALAIEFDLQPETEWWLTGRGIPADLSSRTDVTYEVDQSEIWKRGGIKVTIRDIYVLFADCSQTVITVEFSLQGRPAFQQRIVPPPATLRQDQLVHANLRFGRGLAAGLADYVGQQFPAGQFLSVLMSRNVPESLPMIKNYMYGALVYEQLAANAGGGDTTHIKQSDEIRAGDVVVFGNAAFESPIMDKGHPSSDQIGRLGEFGSGSGSRGRSAGVVYEWDGPRRIVGVYQQAPEEVGGGREVIAQSYELDGLVSGVVQVFRIVGRDFISWT